MHKTEETLVKSMLQVLPDVDLHLLRRDADQRTNRADRLAVPDLGLGERITDDW